MIGNRLIKFAVSLFDEHFHSKRVVLLVIQRPISGLTEYYSMPVPE